MELKQRVEDRIDQWVQEIIQRQSTDGAFRFCFESGIMTDAYTIIVLRVLEMNDEALIQRLVQRILAWQTDLGYWKLYPDEPEGDLSTTIDAYHALLFSGYVRRDDPRMIKAARFIRGQGGLTKASLLTKVMLAVNGHYDWPAKYRLIPLSFLLIPSNYPLNFFDFSSYARIHFVPVLIMANLRYQIKTKWTPDLSELYIQNRSDIESDIWERTLFDNLNGSLKKLIHLPETIHKQGLEYAENYMLKRIESNGTLYSYASSTFLMIYALLALDYPKDSQAILNAVNGLKSLIYEDPGLIHVQNASSTVWDTALISFALQEAGLDLTHQAIKGANQYLIDHQQTKYGDWALKSPGIKPGGWGFSDVNSILPDVDDTTAALRALNDLSNKDFEAVDVWNRGVQWVYGLQNSDGGWSSFEKDTDMQLLNFLPINGAESVATDPSTADLTGRTLEFLGNTIGLTFSDERIYPAVDWLIKNQKEDGSWYGRWGVSYIYGTWAAVTGLRAVGVSAQHPVMQKAVSWLHSIQNSDGGWGESCQSDVRQKYIPYKSTLSQTAWVTDALLSIYKEKTPAIVKGVEFLLRPNEIENDAYDYPTGSGLPGEFYTHYHSYNKIWPLLTLVHFIQ